MKVTMPPTRAAAPARVEPSPDSPAVGIRCRPPPPAVIRHTGSRQLLRVAFSNPRIPGLDQEIDLRSRPVQARPRHRVIRSNDHQMAGTWKVLTRSGRGPHITNRNARHPGRANNESGW